MASTPPPPTRLRTPPTPLHGAKYDSYEPFSPRRSTRLSERYTLSSGSASTPGALRNKRSGGSALSPTLSSPTASPKRKRGGAGKAGVATSSAAAAARRTEEDEEEEEDEAAEEIEQGSSKGVYWAAATTATTSSSRARPPPSAGNKQNHHLHPFVSASTSIDPATMLPTPSKTPHKKRVASTAALKSTARVLFPTRPVAVEDAMPEPRSVKKSRKFKSSFTLNGMDAEESDASGGKIEIYTDVKEREPQRDEASDNPFLGPRKTRGGRGRKKESAKEEDEKERKSDEMREMEEAVARNEGMIYVFRGKKVFRRFESPAADGSTSSPSIPDPTTRRKIGKAAEKPLTRSSIKPRLLWPSKDAAPADGDAEDPEEALTDIEIEDSSPAAAIRGVKKSGPPSASLFSSWRRTKASSSVAAGKAKRAASPMRDGDTKRAKN